MAFRPFEKIKKRLTRVITRVITSRGRSADYNTGFSGGVLDSETARQAIYSITSEIRKCELRHIRTDMTGTFLELVAGPVQNALTNPNPIMTMGDFLEAIAFDLVGPSKTAFVYPKYYADGHIELWPLHPQYTTFSRDPRGNLYVELKFGDGTDVILAYDELAVIRSNYGADDYLGGMGNRDAESATLIELINDEYLLNKAISQQAKSSLQISGLLALPVASNDDEQKAALDEFEAKIDAGKSGIVVTDPKATFTPITSGRSAVDKSFVEYLDDKTLRHYGVSAKIVRGDFTATELRAFYQKTVEPLIVSIQQGLTRLLVTNAGRKPDEKIQVYTNPIISMEISDINDLVEQAGGRGALTNNQILAMYGLPPYEGGDVRMASLNYIDFRYMNQYQLKGAEKEKKDE